MQVHHRRHWCIRRRRRGNDGSRQAVAQHGNLVVGIAHVVFETLTLLVELLLGDDLLFEQRLLLDRAVVLDLHVQE
jgi:hypothetical protein